MKTIRSVLLLVCLLIPDLRAGTTDSEKAIVTAAPEVPWGGPVLGGGIKTNEAFTEGSLFLFQPLLDSIGENGSMEGTVFFLEPYGTWAESGEVGASLGLGFRHLFSQQSVAEALSTTKPGLFGEGVYAGGNLFLDYGQSAYESDFWQGGVGVEVGTRYIELRGNFYLPFTDDQSLGRFTETDVSSHVNSQSKTVYGAPTTSGGQTTQSLTRRTTATTTTSTTRNTYELFEEALQGWDMEVAVLVPGLDEYMDLRLVGGYYDFSGDRSDAEIEGFRAGVELRPIPALVLHGTWYESDQLYQDNWMAGVRVELPLEGMRDAFKMRRRHLAERLFEPVRRKNSAITTSGVQTAPLSSTTTTTTSQSTTNQPLGSVVTGEAEIPDDNDGPGMDQPPGDNEGPGR